MPRPLSRRERFLIGSTILLSTAVLLSFLSPLHGQGSAASNALFAQSIVFHAPQ